MKLINKIYGEIMIPLSYFLRGDFRFYYFDQYTKNLLKSKKEIQKYQLEKLKKLINHAYTTVPYYKTLFDSNRLKPSDIKKVDDLKKIPILTKEIILKNFENLKSTKKYKLLEETSGGSTGNRVTVLKDKRYYSISRAISMRDLYALGLFPGDKSAWIWGSPLENSSLRKNILQRLLWKLNRRIIFNTLNYNNSDLEKWLKRDLMKFKPDYIYGYANAIYDVAKFVKKNNIKLPKIKLIICSANKLEHREFIEDVFKCQVLDQYGSREVLSIAIEDNNYVMHSSDDFVIVELDQNNNILLTPLESYGMPLLRYAIGDIGVKTKTYKKDNHPFNQFKLSIGRSSEILRNKNGNKVSSSKINSQVGKQKLNIGEFQVVQKSFDNVDLNIVKDENTSYEDIDKIKKIIKEALDIKNITVNYYKRFPLEKSGKKISYKCLIKDDEINKK
jgi:phenylacetate-CoA ligase